MFIDSAELYDAIYSFKDYARECDRLRNLINASVPDTSTILDVACGTGGGKEAPEHGVRSLDPAPILESDPELLRNFVSGRLGSAGAQ
jgi:hypothetical protein